MTAGTGANWQRRPKLHSGVGKHHMLTRTSRGKIRLIKIAHLVRRHSQTVQQPVAVFTARLDYRNRRTLVKLQKVILAKTTPASRTETPFIVNYSQKELRIKSTLMKPKVGPDFNISDGNNTDSTSARLFRKFYCYYTVGYSFS